MKMIIYSPQCHPRCSWLSFFSGKSIKFEENISGFFSTLWTSTVTKSMQFQGALKSFTTPAEEQGLILSYLKNK